MSFIARLMLDCKQLQVGDYCVATVPRRSTEASMPIMPSQANANARGNQGEQINPVLDPSFHRSHSDGNSGNSRKRRAPSFTKTSVSLPSETFASSSGSRLDLWNTSLHPRVSLNSEMEQQDLLQPTDLRTSKSREQEEKEVCTGSMWEVMSNKKILQNRSLCALLIFKQSPFF